MNHNKSTICLNLCSFVFIVLVNSIEFFSFFVVLIVSMVGLRQTGIDCIAYIGCCLSAVIRGRLDGLTLGV